MIPDAGELLPFIEETARAAGAIHMRHFRRLAGYDRKAANDLVTVADRESEDEIARRLRGRFPGHALMLEESGGEADEFTWIVDPVDGTTNFAHGLRLFATSIALVHRGRPVAGGIYAPALEEYYAVARGHGAWRNGSERLSVSRARTLADGLVVTGFPYNRQAVLGGLMEMMACALSHSQGCLRLGAATLDFAAVAAGHLDVFYEYNLKPWDVAAGSLLVEEAGGRVTDFAGEAYDVTRPSTTLATNGFVHGEAVGKITGRFATAFPAVY